jgi:hypothetical protein
MLFLGLPYNAAISKTWIFSLQTEGCTIELILRKKLRRDNSQKGKPFPKMTTLPANICDFNLNLSL